MEFQFFVFFTLSLSSTLCLTKTTFGDDGYSYKVSNFTDQNVTYCFREHENDKLDVREILGRWNVIVVYMHLSMEGVKEYPFCPEVTIWETEDFPRTTFGVCSAMNKRSI